MYFLSDIRSVAIMGTHWNVVDEGTLVSVSTYIFRKK